MSSFLSECRELVAAYAPDLIRDRLMQGCWIYGAGGYGRRIAHAMKAYGMPCRGFIDRRGNGSSETCDELPLLGLNQFTRSLGLNTVLVVGVMNENYDLQEIIDWSDKQSFSDIVFPPMLSNIIGKEADNYWMTNREITIDNLDAIDRADKLMADQTSSETLKALTRFRLTGDPKFHPPVDRAHIYAPPDLPNFKTPIVFVDGGAFEGESYFLLEHLGVKVEQWIAFEPDLQNLRGLAEKARAAQCNRVMVFPCGLSNHFDDLIFESGLATGSRFHSANTQSPPAGGAFAVVRTVALDEILRGIVPHYIKLDIEGAESDALDGMKEILAQGQTRLAVSAYHKPQDLWCLIEKVAKICSSAKLYLRQHGYSGFDTVLYAIPPSQAEGPMRS